MSTGKTPPPITLQTVPGCYGLVRLDHDASVPDWFDGPGLTAAVRASDELKHPAFKWR